MLKNEGLCSSLSSLPYTAWKIIGKFLFGSCSQSSITFLWEIIMSVKGIMLPHVTPLIGNPTILHFFTTFSSTVPITDVLSTVSQLSLGMECWKDCLLIALRLMGCLLLATLHQSVTQPLSHSVTQTPSHSVTQSLSDAVTQ